MHVFLATYQVKIYLYLKTNKTLYHLIIHVFGKVLGPSGDLEMFLKISSAQFLNLTGLTYINTCRSSTNNVYLQQPLA